MDDLPWGHSIITLEDRLQEIENLLSSKFYQAALALALTVPDICGKVEFPKEGVPFKKIHRIREIAQHGAKYKKTTMFYDMIVIRVCPRNRGATTNNLLCECILAQTSSRFLGLPKISFSDLPSWIRETARLIQQRSCAGFTPSFLRPFRRKIRKTLFNCNA